mgnify:FL=1
MQINVLVTFVPGVSGNQDVLVRVTDNGTGIDEKTLVDIHEMLRSNPIARRNSGFGLLNVHARTVMLFGEGYGTTVESKLNEGTSVELRIPIIDSFEQAQLYDRREGGLYIE